MTTDLVAKLSEHGINSRDDLADLATDELAEMADLSAEQAAEFIMAARAHWFEDQQ